MAIDINFGALQTPNPFQAYAQGQEVGQQQRQRKARQEAGNVFATDPDKAAQILMGAGDWEGGLTARKYAREDKQDKARTAAVDAYTKGDVKGAQAAAVGAGDFELSTAIGKMDAEQRAQVKEHAQDLGAYAMTLKGLPYEEARAHIQQDRPLLLQKGFTAEQLDAFDPTPQNLDGVIGQAMDLKTALEQAEKQREFGLKKDQFGETVRNHKATEGIAAKNANTSAYSAQTGRLSYDARKASGGFGTPGVGGMFPTLPGDPNDYEHHPAGGE